MTRGLSYTTSRGIATILFALIGSILIIFAAFAVDIGLIRVAKNELQAATDSGAKAGADLLSVLNDNISQEAIIEKALEFVNKHTIYGKTKPQNVTVDLGDWDNVAKVFTVDNESPTAVRVRSEYQGKHYLARIINKDNYKVTAESIAVKLPRDIVFSVDISESMNDDSELKFIPLLGAELVKANLLKIYQELGSPQYGAMTWDSIYIPSGNADVVITTLGLDTVDYPYPRGSWKQYVSYVSKDSGVAAAGYKKKYGYLTLVDFWLNELPAYNETPDLWKTSEQPLATAKNAVDYVLSKLNAGDRAALITYNTKDGMSGLEVPLTSNKQLITDLLRGDIANNIPGRQAGHWHKFTNIAAGIKNSRNQLNSQQTYAEKQIIVISDGKSTWNAHGLNASISRRDTINQANFAKNDNVIISTISLGGDADTNLMDEIANITGGYHINIPPGDDIDDHIDSMKLFIQNIASRAVLVK